MNEELGYVSSQPLFVQKDEPRVRDEADISVIEEAFEVLKDRTAYYESVSSLSLDPEMLKVFSIEQQLAINKKMTFHLQELEALLANTINKVKEKQNGR